MTFTAAASVAIYSTAEPVGTRRQWPADSQPKCGDDSDVILSTTVTAATLEVQASNTLM